MKLFIFVFHHLHRLVQSSNEMKIHTNDLCLYAAEQGAEIAWEDL